jgi:hypothetical protein
MTIYNYFVHMVSNLNYTADPCGKYQILVHGHEYEIKRRHMP